MTDKHPYVSGTGVLKQVLDYLRKSFPAKLDAEVLRKLGFAPQNESYVMNTVRFLGLINDAGARSDKAQKVFTLQDEAVFSRAFADLVKTSYSELFSLHSEDTWTLDQASLITFFRQTDQSTQLVGTLQAKTFRALASYAGHVESVGISPQKSPARADRKPATTKGASGTTPRGGSLGTARLVKADALTGGGTERNLGLTLRIEINLPLAADQETYDRIFKSIRENLLNV